VRCFKSSLGGAAVLASTLLFPAIGSADERSEHGRALLANNCANCHAIGRTGQSPLVAAPPFRRLSDRLDFDELMERLLNGLSSGHRDMPAFRFSREDAHAIRSYLNSIQD